MSLSSAIVESDAKFSSTTPDKPQNTDRFRFSLKAFLLAIPACAIIAFGAKVGWDRTQENVQETRIVNGLKDVYIGLHNFNTAKDRLPAPTFDGLQGQPLSSWRFQILPYMGVNHLGRQYYVSAWTAPINRGLAAGGLTSYCLMQEDDLHTCIFAIAGPGCAIDKGSYNGFAKAVLEDALPHTILAMEVADSKTHWMQPGDYDVTKLLAAKGDLGDHVKSILPHRIHVLFADGEVWTLSDETPMAAIKPFLTLAAAKSHDRDELLAKYRVD